MAFRRGDAGLPKRRGCNRGDLRADGGEATVADYESREIPGRVYDDGRVTP